MAVNLSITEVMGRIDSQGKLSVDETFAAEGPVRVWVVSEPGEDAAEERGWLAAIAGNPAFADLNDAGEDIYTLNDGRPFQH